MRYGLSFHILIFGCVILVHCQRPPSDDEDFPFAHEGSGREVLAPPAGRSQPVPAPPASGQVYGSPVSHQQPPPSYSGFPREDDQYYGSGDGDYNYDDYDYYDEEYDYDDESYYGSEDPAPDAGRDQQYRPQPDHVAPEVVVPPRRPDEEHSVGVVHAVPPPLPEHTERPDHYGDLGVEHGRPPPPPPVYGTELRPTEPPRPEPEQPEMDNDIDLAPEVELHAGAGVESENAIPDSTANGQPAGAMPDGMGSKAIDRPTSFFAQPGILAAVVGGAVVGLLCAILLVMLIVYRMRKKDEGSYALEEPKRSLTGNSYSKNYNKEFYA
ncbi:syndecan-like isoform X2 [Amphibalanus amphitrite]|uniref:syndecan-like isoform X2 n=1 Tax=Amphibalanus amphitrite TaxID=1232801 RepID=UPI001C920EE6|nr:syndecan-like isoform X2 [Amphibalanus amphitrite]